MTTIKHTLSKNERLSWKRYIDLLFEQGQSVIAFPLRVIFLSSDEEMPARCAIMVSVSKKKLKRAVWRNYVKRQVKEAYRLRKHTLIDTLEEKNKYLSVAFLYLENEMLPTKEIEKAMDKAIRLLKEKA